MDKVVADNFDGRILQEGFVKNLQKEREAAKNIRRHACFMYDAKEKNGNMLLTLI